MKWLKPGRRALIFPFLVTESRFVNDLFVFIRGASLSKYKGNVKRIASLETGKGKISSRMRKFAIKQGVNLLVENDQKSSKVIRVAVLEYEWNQTISHQLRDFIKSIDGTVNISTELENVINPVLSKLKINDESRYEI